MNAIVTDDFKDNVILWCKIAFTFGKVSPNAILFTFNYWTYLLMVYNREDSFLDPWRLKLTSMSLTMIKYCHLLNIPMTLFWETLLVTLRGEIIRYASRKNRERRRDREALQSEINNLDNKINTGNGNLQDFTRLINLNNNLIDIRKQKLEGALIRSRADWLDYGEKPSKYFLNLEHKNMINKNINEIKINETTTVTDQEAILSELKTFYENLYAEKQIEKTTNYFPNTTTNKLTDYEKKLIEGPITKEELDNALQKMKNNKSPGLDGFSPEFFKRFWPVLGYFFLEYINSNFEKGELSMSQTEGIITCLPKTGKERILIKNWRPISKFKHESENVNIV